MTVDLVSADGIERRHSPCKGGRTDTRQQIFAVESEIETLRAEHEQRGEDIAGLSGLRASTEQVRTGGAEVMFYALLDTVKCCRRYRKQAESVERSIQAEQMQARLIALGN